MWRWISFIIILAMTGGAMKRVMCTLITMKIYNSGIYVAMNESMFLRLHQCMDDTFSERCLLNLTSETSIYFTVNNVVTQSASIALSSPFICSYGELDSLLSKFNASCVRSSDTNCQGCVRESDSFAILWNDDYQSFNDSYHTSCQNEYNCKVYGKLATTTITSTSPNSYATTKLIETATQLQTEFHSTWSASSDSSNLMHYVTEIQSPVNETNNTILNSGSGLPENNDVKSIILGSVISAVLVLVTALVIIIVWKRRCLGKEKEKNAYVSSDFQQNNIKHNNEANVATSSVGYDIYTAANSSEDNQYYELSSESLSCTFTGGSQPTGPNNEIATANDKYLDSNDIYTEINSSQDNDGTELSSESLTYKFTGGSKPTIPNNEIATANDKYLDSSDIYTEINSSQDNDGNELSRESLPKEKQPSKEYANQSDKMNNIYKNVNDKLSTNDLKEYARLGQELKVFKNDYNDLIPDQEVIDTN